MNPFENVTSKSEFNDKLQEVLSSGGTVEKYLCRADYMDLLRKGIVYVVVREEMLLGTHHTTLREESTGERVMWDLRDYEVELYLTKI